MTRTLFFALLAFLGIPPALSANTEAPGPSNTSNSEFSLKLDNPAPELLPHIHKAEYTASIKKGIRIKGKAVRELKKHGNKWHYNFDVDSMAADIDESLTFSWDANSIVPENYNYELSGFFIRDRKRSAKFDWLNQQVVGRNNGKNWTLPSQKGLLDRLGYQLQLCTDIALGKHRMVYDIAYKGRVETSIFEVVGEEQIETAIGLQNSVIVRKVREQKKKRKTRLWFSKEKPFLLLKMYQKEKDGEEYEVNLQRVINYTQPSNNNFNPIP